MSMAVLLAVGVVLLCFLFLLWFESGKREPIKWIELNKPAKKERSSFFAEGERLGVSVQKQVIWWGLAFGIGVGLSFLFLNPFITILVLIANYFSIKMFYLNKERHIRDLAKEQLGPALQNLGAAYRIQKNWKRALETTIPSLDEPLKSEFMRVYQLHSSDVLIGEALQEMMERLKVPEMNLFVKMAEISQSVGDSAAEGVLVAGAYFQTKRVAKMDLANAMLSAVRENRWLSYLFIAAVAFFRFFQPEIFAVYTKSLVGQCLLTVYLGIALFVPIVSYFIIRKEV
jgi:Flp pilus assembly protein TadB